MAQNKPYEKKRLQKVWEDVQQNEFDTDKLPIIKKKLEPEHFIKRKRIITLAEGYRFAEYSADYHFEKEFKNFPEWAITHSKLVINLYTSDGNYIPFRFGDERKGYLSCEPLYLWKLLDKTANNWVFRLNVQLTTLTNQHPSEDNNTIEVPVYGDIYLFFYNQRIYHEIQHK